MQMAFRLVRALFVLVSAMFALHALADDSKPPLVVEAGKYSYTFALPAGWEVSEEEAKRLKVPLMMFPQNRSFTQSASIVFIDEYCKTPCANPAEPVRSILAHAKTRDPDFKSQTPSPLQTRDGSAIDLRIVDSTINKRPVREAFAFINNPGSTLVMARLAVGDLAVWDRDFKVFTDTLTGFQFFDCSAAGKGRGLGMCGPEPEVKIDPTSFEGRAAIAKALYATPDGEAYRKLVNQYLAARHSKTMRNCFDTTQDPWTANFELIGFIDKTGSLTDAVVKPETNIATCFATGLLNSIFPFAPKLPEGGDLYPIYMEVRLQP
jgi:hypothetical protein